MYRFSSEKPSKTIVKPLIIQSITTQSNDETKKKNVNVITPNSNPSKEVKVISLNKAPGDDNDTITVHPKLKDTETDETPQINNGEKKRTHKRFKTGAPP